MDTSLRPLPPGVVVPISGISNYQAAAALTSIGDEVVLRHEFSNFHDRDAVLIETTDGQTLGYVPRSAQQNQRLLVGHQGGMWSGVVVDKFDHETIGLRVKILALIGHLNPAYGADIPGIRDTAEPAEDVLLGRDPEPAVEEPAPLLAFTRSGRLLGTVLEQGPAKVRVKSTAGATLSYPASVVEVRCAALA